MTSILVGTGLCLRSCVWFQSVYPCSDAILGLDLAPHQLWIFDLPPVGMKSRYMRRRNVNQPGSLPGWSLAKTGIVFISCRYGYFGFKFALFLWVPYLIQFSTCLPEVQCLNGSSSHSQLWNPTQSLTAEHKKAEPCLVNQLEGESWKTGTTY